MKVYAVGGSVRDEIMGVKPKDLDYVVTGSTPDEMLSLGYTQAGKGFPVFIHPATGEEYALARTGKSTGEKYGDFDCYFGKDVTLEDDLSRRDLTINAIAKDLTTGELIDPFGGVKDIEDKIIRHVSDAFSEDPVRVLRVFRFMATLSGTWSLDKSTLVMITYMAIEGNLLENLTPERVWKEVEKALNGHTPSVLFKALADLGLFPEVYDLHLTPQNEEHHPEGNVGIHSMMVVDYAAKYFGPVVVFAGLCHDFGKPEAYEKSGNALEHEILGLPIIEEFCKKWKVPNNYRDLALMTCRYRTKVHGCLGRDTNAATKPKSIMKLFTQTNALAGEKRFLQFLQACEADAKGRGGDYPNKPYPQAEYLLDCLMAAKTVNTGMISTVMLEKGKSGIEIGEAIRIARIDAIRGIKNGT